MAEGDDGRALLYCRAGCRTSEFVAALGLRYADLFPPRMAGVPRAWRCKRARWTRDRPQRGATCSPKPGASKRDALATPSSTPARIQFASVIAWCREARAVATRLGPRDDVLDLLSARGRPRHHDARGRVAARRQPHGDGERVTTPTTTADLEARRNGLRLDGAEWKSRVGDRPTILLSGDLADVSRAAWVAIDAANDPPFLFRYGDMPYASSATIAAGS